MDFIVGIYYKLNGWRIEGNPQLQLKKGIWVVGPHTSFLDFFAGLALRYMLPLDIGFLGKHTLFTWYGSWFFRALNCYPVDRTKTNNLVGAVAGLFKKHDTLRIALAHEGTRKNVKNFKTGFYFIALEANVPIVLAGFELKNKKAVFGPIIYPTGNYKEDMKPFYEFFSKLDAPKKDWLLAYEATGEIVEPTARK
jgi:1-acyl-sn-glycerol-3-phosphate acyltransferase